MLHAQGDVAMTELEMLQSGMTYAEIAELSGISSKTIAERNRLKHKVDLRVAFMNRLDREGIPQRLSCDDAFGYWFSGFFDGEGHFGAYSIERKNGGKIERRLIIQIGLRRDDESVLYRIQNGIGAGNITQSPARPPSEETSVLRIQPIAVLREIVVPLFERYPLYTKKAKEFEVWKQLVHIQYLRTLGGRHRSSGTGSSFDADFDRLVQEIADIRRYK